MCDNFIAFHQEVANDDCLERIIEGINDLIGIAEKSNDLCFVHKVRFCYDVLEIKRDLYKLISAMDDRASTEELGNVLREIHDNIKQPEPEIIN